MLLLDQIKHRWTGSISFRKRQFQASKNQWIWKWHRKGDLEIGILQPFVRPFGLSFDKKGNAFVADFDGHRVIRFSPNWEFSGWLGHAKNTKQQINGWSKEKGLAVESAKPGGFSRPHNITFDRDDNIIVTELTNARLQRFSEDGRHLGYIGEGETGSPPLKGPVTSCYCDDGYLYVTDFLGHCFHRYTHDDRFVDWMAISGGGFSSTGLPPKERQPNQFFKPHVARLNKDGFILVVDTLNHCVIRFDSNGSYAGWIGAKIGGGLTDGWEMGGHAKISSEPGGFKNPSSLQFTPDGQMIIAESLNNRIQKFSNDGNFLGWIGEKDGGGVTISWEKQGFSKMGNKPGAFNHPFDAVLHNDVLYVVDTENGRLQAIRGL
ncbi:MAG: NHL repeat-containing protein [Pseudomonadota bacterium]|nr:NHL repeat-containing protein [Pseudomonadota bacterium]